MGVASGCDEQEVGVASGSGWNLWVWLLSVVVRRYIDFLILLIPTPLVSVLFCSILLFVLWHLFEEIGYIIFSKLWMFFVLVPVLFVITFYVLNKFFAQYKHTDRQLQAQDPVNNSILSLHLGRGMVIQGEEW